MTRPRAFVLTVSTRAAAGAYADRSGPLLAGGLAGLGLSVTGPVVVPDGAAVGDALRAAVAAGYDIVVTTGGTGIAPDDRTPEETRAVVDRLLPGVPEALRAAGMAGGVPTAMLSRGVAGVAGRTLIVNLPGSAGAVRDGLAVLGPVLPHALEQVRGADHARGSSGGSSAEGGPGR